MKLGHKIKKVRELKNLTQEHVAGKLGMTQSAYSKIETEETDITVKRLERIADLLGMLPEELIGFNESMVFNLSNNKKASGLVINQMSSNERKVYEDHISTLKNEITHLKQVMNKILGTSKLHTSKNQKK
mgnify:CR=1 FL=1